MLLVKITGRGWCRSSVPPVECFNGWFLTNAPARESAKVAMVTSRRKAGSSLFGAMTISIVFDHAHRFVLPGNDLFIDLSILEHQVFALASTSTGSLGDTLSLMIQPIFHGLCLLASEPPSDSSNQSRRVMRFVLKAPAKTGVIW